jgi:hypothetical protein
MNRLLAATISKQRRSEGRAESESQRRQQRKDARNPFPSGVFAPFPRLCVSAFVGGIHGWISQVAKGRAEPLGLDALALNSQERLRQALFSLAVLCWTPLAPYPPMNRSLSGDNLKAQTL